MTSRQARMVLEQFQEHCRAICDIAKVAKRNSKSLSGHNPYSERFHDAIVALSKAEIQLGPVLISAELDEGKSKELSSLLDTLKSPKLDPRQRHEALKSLQLLCQASVLPAIERLSGNPVPETEQVLPLEIVRPTRRTYLERVVLQANGCYEHRWYDACSVMIRRLVETIIVELYEAKGNEAAIKNAAGEFLMLNGLVDAVLAEKSWNLGREVKKTLPEIKLLGDRSAHTRRYVATKHDVDKVIGGLRVVVEDLLHLAGLL
jgi:Domain of unknown function (DUF4145)